MKRKTMSLILTMAMLIAFLPVISAQAASIGIGEYVQMGTYYDEPILWRCVDIDENGPLMLSDKIICIKPYDAWGEANTETGSHSRSSERQSWGSNYWADSNMRSWLNSNESAGNVTWLCGNPPDEDHVLNGYNEYDQEAGFLTNFSQSELNAVKKVKQKSIVAYPEYNNGIYTTGTEVHEYYSSITEVVANYDNAFAEYVTDKMFLLDVKQVNAVYNNSDVLGENYYIGEPTEKCVANSEYTSSSLTAGEKWYYWLRSPYAYYGFNAVRDVNPEGEVYDDVSSIESLGVRPAFYLKTDYASFTSGSGTDSDPYTVEGTEEPPITADMSYADGVVTIEASGSATAELYIVSYNTDGSLLDCAKKELNLAEGTNSENISENVEEISTGSGVKLMLWDEDMRPLCEPYTMD